MQDLELNVVSAHPDYTPNQFDYDFTTRLFGATIGDYSFAILRGADDSGYLTWNDGVANEWIEHYEKVSHAIARLAHLQHCAESAWKKGFESTPLTFAQKFEFLMQDKWV